METFQAIGGALLVFEVLPKIDAIRGAMLTNAVCFIPSVLCEYGFYNMTCEFP